jgi:type II secretory ATPase GspE/PulE/Tfp pilus assembly ATPase PilB-like protein
MPLFASWWLGAELSTFRGPGYYFSIVKLAIVIGLYFSWVGTASWVNRDAAKSQMNTEHWNPLLLASGVCGLLLLWEMPVFFLGFLAFVACLAGGSLSYIYLRNQRVPAEQQVLTQDHLNQLVKQILSFKFRTSKQKEDEVRNTIQVRLLTRDGLGREDDRNLLARAEGSRGYQAALQLVHHALRHRAMDIHLQPMDDQMGVRFCIDGIMHPSQPFTRSMGLAVVNVFKIMCNMDVTEKRKPQVGSFSAEVEGRKIDFRVASAGTLAGAKVVLRVLDRAAQIVSLKQLGMDDKIREDVSKLIGLPHAMIIVCGPGGAGKSTSLYAFLNEIDRAQRKIVTLECPIEYELAKVSQIAVDINARKTFAPELRSVLRQKPNVIMIGEILDRETAELACQAVQTGHMIFTTLDANDTVTAIGRLIDLGVQPVLLSSTLTAVLGQRLVRLLCPRCKERYKPNTDLLQRLNLPVEKIKYFYRPPGSKGDDGGEAKVARDVCEHCGGTGYLGRTGIFELLVLNEAIRRLICQNPNLNDIKQEAVKAGMRYLYEDGLRQVIEGRTSIQELLRVSC